MWLKVEEVPSDRGSPGLNARGTGTFKKMMEGVFLFLVQWFGVISFYSALCARSSMEGRYYDRAGRNPPGITLGSGTIPSLTGDVTVGKSPVTS